MSSNPYIRPGLEATRSQIPDPGIEVEDWLDKLGDLLDGKRPQGRAHQAYDLLALWAKLQRIEPNLLAKHGGEADLKRAKVFVDEKGRELAQLALTVPNTDAWLEEAQALAESYEDLIDPVQRAELAENLLADLDDAELAVYAAKRIGLVDAELNQQLVTCAKWVAEHADFFLAAAVHVQAVGMAFRPDLCEWDAELARTADKFVRVLDAQEIAEAELSFANQPRVDRAVIRHLFSFARKKILAFPHAWLTKGRNLAAFSATDAETEVSRPGGLLRWMSPEEAMSAVLVIPEEFAGNEMLSVTFLQSDGKPALALVGQLVLLASVASIVGESAKAVFTLRGLRTALLDLKLEVGEDRVLWIPEEI